MKKLLAKWLLGALAANASASAIAAQCDTMRVMTFNIRLGTARDGENDWTHRRDQLIGQVELMRPDLLGLQEVVLEQKRDLELAMPSYEFLGVARDDGREAGEFSNIAVRRDRFKVMSSGTFWLSMTPEVPSKGWDAAYPRIATWARLQRLDDGRKFFVVNTHLDNKGPVARLQGAKMIGTYLAVHRKPGDSVIMTGDFNSAPDSGVLAELINGPAKLRDSRADGIAPPLGPEGTFNGFSALPTTSTRIDYVLHDPDWRTIRNTTLSMHGEGGRTASDHFAVVADLVERACIK